MSEEGPELVGVYSTSLIAGRAIQVASEHIAANEARGTEEPLFLYLPFQMKRPTTIMSPDIYTD